MTKHAPSWCTSTILNELDVVEHSPAVAAAHGADLRELFGSWLPLCSPQVRDIVTRWTGNAVRS